MPAQASLLPLQIVHVEAQAVQVTDLLCPHRVTHNEDGLSLMLAEQMLDGLHGKVCLPLLHHGVSVLC